MKLTHRAQPVSISTVMFFTVLALYSTLDDKGNDN